MRLIALIIALCLSAGMSSLAGDLEIIFSPDSLSGGVDQNYFSYPGTQTLIINENLSLPVRTLYINSSTDISTIDITVSVEENIVLGAIPSKSTIFRNIITTLDSGRLGPPVDEDSNLRNCLWHTQKIRKDGLTFFEISILPITLDDNNNLVLNTRINIALPFSPGQSLDGQTLHSVLDNSLSRSDLQAVETVSSVSDNNISAKFVIITSPELAIPFRELADFRNATGVPTSIELLDSIITKYDGCDIAEKIRNYLLDFYDNGGEYVLLGGNDAVVPVRYLYYYNASTLPSDLYNLMPSDLYYADLNGDWDVDGDGIWGEPSHDAPDIVPELKVGRLPVNTVEAVDNYVSKLLLYQTNPGYGDTDYLERMLMFSSDQMRDYPSAGQHGYIAAEIPSYIYVDTGQTIEMPDGYDLNPTNPEGEFGIQKISEGFGLIHILAHGRTDGFRVKAANYGGTTSSLILTTPQTGGHGSITDLEPNGRVSLYYSLSCQVGGYDLDSTDGEKSDWSFVEKAVSVDNAGAVGMVAYSRWGWVYSSYLLEASFTKHLYGDAAGSPVKAMYYSWLDYPYYRDLIYGQNFFGDPNLLFYRSAPAILELEILSDSGASICWAKIDDIPAPDIPVVLSLNGEILEKGQTSTDGHYTIRTELEYGKEYCFTAYDSGCTFAREYYSPAFTLNSEEETDWSLPAEYSLEQNYPNPFNPTTTIEYGLPKISDVALDIFNILGQLVFSIHFGGQTAGIHSYTWSGFDSANRQLSSGIYLYRLTAGDFIETRKMTLVK